LESDVKNKKALIIGGGIAGLCTGVYLQKNGFETEILEMHSIAGGLATAWKRSGFTFENCIHWLVGSKERDEFNATWKEVFDIGRLEFHDDEIYQVIEKGDQKLVVYRDVDRMEREFLARAPEDAAVIREFTGLVRKLSSFRFPGGDSLFPRLASLARALPNLWRMHKYSKFTLAGYGERVKNPLLKSFFTSGLGELSFLAIAFSLAWMTRGNAGYPIGGSLAMIGLITDRYRALGGSIRFDTRVERIVVRNGRAAGVVIEGGEEITADLVVSAADGHTTVFQFLEGKFLGGKIEQAYKNYRLFPSYVQVSLGVDADLKREPGFLLLLLDEHLAIDPETRQNFLSLRIFNFDPTFAPAGKTAVVCFLATYNHAYWVSLDERDRAAYEAEKQRVACEVIRIFEHRFPTARGRIEVVDVATPSTVIRYTGNWKGSMEGWLLTPSTGFRPLPPTLPGLKDFYMVGQWVSPGGGLPSGLLTARNTSRLICRDNGLTWKAD
jgi:phytoene dehydrogenase-like protein